MRGLVVVLVAVLAVAGCGASRHAAKAATTPATSQWRPVGPDALRGRAAREATVPILTYHVLAPAPARAPYPDLWMPPGRFAKQMQALHRAGFRAVTLQQVLAAWSRGAALPRHPVVLTFDDGYPSQYDVAFQTLHRLGWAGVLNLEVRNLGPRGLLPEQVSAMQRDGWEIDSHTVTHPDLTKVSSGGLRYQVEDSRRLIQQQFGPRTARVFCYPEGQYNPAVEAAVRAAGYAAATTTADGLASAAGDRFALPRITVRRGASPAALVAALRGASS